MGINPKVWLAVGAKVLRIALGFGETVEQVLAGHVPERKLAGAMRGTIDEAFVSLNAAQRIAMEAPMVRESLRKFLDARVAFENAFAAEVARVQAMQVPGESAND